MATAFYTLSIVNFKFYSKQIHNNTLSYHVVRPVSDGLVPRRRNALLGVSVTEAASLHDQVVDGEVPGGKLFVGGGDVFGLTGARLMLQQSDADVGHPQLLLALHPERVQGLPLREGAVDHLLVRKREI